MKGVILSAGFGKRLRPITENIPKGLIPILNRPVLEYILLGFRYAEIKDVVIVIGYLGEKIKDYSKNGKEFGLNISYLIQENPNGTGSALLLTKDFIKDSPFILSWGDVIVGKENYLNIRKLFEEDSCDGVIGINYEEDLSQKGAVFLEINGKVKIKDIIEKPKEKVNTNWNQTGIFALNSVIFKYLEKIAPSERGEYEFTSAIKMMLQDNLYLRPYFIKDFHLEIGSIKDLERIEKYKEFLQKF